MGYSPSVPMHVDFYDRLFFPLKLMSKSWELWSLNKVPDCLKLRFLTSSESKKKENRLVCLRVAKASRAHKTWPGVSRSAPHLLHKGLPDWPHYEVMSSQGVMSSTEANNSPGFYPVKNSSLVLAVRLGHEISFGAHLLSTFKTPPHFHALVVNPA
jgi:hypothetical protein